MIGAPERHTKEGMTRKCLPMWRLPLVAVPPIPSPPASLLPVVGGHGGRWRGGGRSGSFSLAADKGREVWIFFFLLCSFRNPNKVELGFPFFFLLWRVLLCGAALSLSSALPLILFSHCRQSLLVEWSCRWPSFERRGWGAGCGAEVHRRRSRQLGGRRHGGAVAPVWAAWWAMMQRCGDANLGSWAVEGKRLRRLQGCCLWTESSLHQLGGLAFA
jgi:hypothetical protein